MIVKPRTRFVCQECGYVSARWMGKCPGCGSWNTMVEEVLEKTTRLTGNPGKADISKLSEVPPVEDIRFSSGLAEMDRVLGGGVVSGSLMLLGGDPGVGKSTLLLEVAGALGKAGVKTLFVSAEESPRQIAMRAQRLGLDPDKIYILGESVVERVVQAAQDFKPQVLFVDSVQTVFLDALTSSPGSVSQVREIGNAFLRLAKQQGTSVFLVGHVTKDGTIAGPRTLEHMVDVVLYLEGEKGHQIRVLRSPKNRFGSTDETGLFEMTEKGLVPAGDISHFLSSGPDEPGVAVAAITEGARALLVEMQALVSFNPYPTPTRTTTGFDHRRAAMLMAVLERRAGVRIRNQDVYVNVVGGLRVVDPGADLALCAAIASSARNARVPEKSVFVGEVGLGGEIRPVKGLRPRLLEAARAGFKTAFVPKAGETEGVKGLEIRPVSHIAQVIARLGGKNEN